MELNKNMFLIFLFTIFTPVYSYNILVFFTYASRSHFSLYRPLFTQLANNGHNVTVIGYFPLSIRLPNYRDIVLGENSREVKEFLDFDTINDEWTFAKFKIFLEYFNNTCTDVFESKHFQEFVKEVNKFDLVLVQYFMSECVMSLISSWNVPYIGKLRLYQYP